MIQQKQTVEKEPEMQPWETAITTFADELRRRIEGARSGHTVVVEPKEPLNLEGWSVDSSVVISHPSCGQHPERITVEVMETPQGPSEDTTYIVRAEHLDRTGKHEVFARRKVSLVELPGALRSSTSDTCQDAQARLPRF